MRRIHPQIVHVLKQKIRQAKARGRKLVLPRPLKPLQPRSIQRDYTKSLYSVIQKLESVFKSQVIPKISPIIEKAQKHRSKKDSLREDYSDDIGRTVKHAKIEFESVYNPQTLGHIARRVANKTYAFEKEQSSKQMMRLLGVDVFTAEPWLEPETKAFVAENVNLISKWSDDLFTKAEEIIYRGARNGDALKDIASELKERIGVTESRYDMIARDQVSKFNGNLNELRQTELGVEKYTWDTCVTPETVVMAFGAEKAMRRKYKGDIIEIKTASGGILRVTPNHKIFTRRGWIAASVLHQGDDLIRYIPEVERARILSSSKPFKWINRSKRMMPNIDHMPTKISDFFVSARKVMTRHGMMRIVPYFNGKRQDGNIEIVLLDRKLSQNVEAICPKRFRKFFLKLPDFHLDLLFNRSSPFKRFHAFFSYSICFDHFCYPLSFIFTRFFRNPHKSSGRKISPRLFESFQSIYNRILTTIKECSQFPSRHPCAVFLDYDRCVFIRSEYFSGHVYDLQTFNHWMIANSFIVHNSNDERVRPMHADLQDDVFEWADPPVTNEDGDTNNPSEDFSCRCIGLAYLDDIIDELSDEVDDEEGQSEGESPDEESSDEEE